jgi:hypothetical protein
MRSNIFKSILIKSGLAASVLLLANGEALAVQQVNLTAAPATVTMPDGTAVPMWGYTCTVTGTAALSGAQTCAALSPTPGWSPIVITVPTGQDLTISLTNNLSFANGNNVPTSIMIVGQLGGGLGTTATSTPSPNHSGAQTNLTWPIAGAAGNPGVPPTQANRVQSFSTEVAAGATTALTWTAPRPGTYLIESGTHPSIQGTMGLYGILVVTSAPTTAAGTAYGTAGTASAVSYNAEVPLLLSEIDPVQNLAVSTAVNTAGFSETTVWSGQPGGCGNPASVGVYQTCYPPVVNYTPLYYLINGVAFNKTNAAASVFAPLPLPTGATAPVAGNPLLVRLVNAGSRMHVPAIVGAQTGASGTSGFALIAEDGNVLPGVSRVQNEVFLAAGKTYDVMVNVPASGATALPIYDRELSLSGNATARDAGMLAYISVNGAAAPSATVLSGAVANPDTYISVVPGNTLTVSDPSRGVIANDINVYGVKVLTAPTKGTLTLNTDGTFTYVPNAGWSGVDSFVYQANGNGPTATVTLNAAPIEAASGIRLNPISYTSTLATSLSIKTPGILSVDLDNAGYPLSVVASSVTPSTGLTVSVDATGAFNASVASPGTYTFTYKAQNSQGTVSSSAATVTLTFPTATNLNVTVLDGTDKTTVISDYRWIIEEDRTFYVDPTKTTNTGGTSIVPTFGTNFHTSFMPVVATGCTGLQSCEGGQSVLNVSSVCDVGDGACRPGAQQTAVLPSQVNLDPTKHYYLSVLPGDAANPFQAGNLTAACAGGVAPIVSAGGDPTICGHGMGGVPVVPTCTTTGTVTTCAFTPVTVLTQPTPFPPAKLSVFVFEDDFPLNGENDAGGGVDVISPNEPGLGSFNIHIMDDAGGPGDSTGQVDYDMFNQPLSNSLSGTLDPATGLDACPISAIARIGTIPDPAHPGQTIPDLTQTGITGTIVTCPKYEGDGTKQILSPLAGQAVVANMMPGRYGIVATPGADRIARGEEWLQTNTLDGQKAHDSFLRIGEPSFFQEFGPAGYHVSIGFANPAIINGRLKGVCGGADLFVQGTHCTNTVTGTVTTERMSRTPDERLYSSGSRGSFAFTQCYVSFGDPDGEDFAFTKCNPDGTFTMTGLPDGDWRITTFDQWNDQLVDGLSTPVRLTHGANTACGGPTASATICDVGDIAANQWQANFYTRTFLDTNKNGVSDKDANGVATEPGLALVKTNVRFRDGSFSNRNNTDLNGFAGFNEEFPLFNWYVIETDVSRYKNTGTHVVYDSGGPADGSASCGNGTNFPLCDVNAVISKNLANTVETVPLPTDLRVPGAVYCDHADCTGLSIATGPGGPGGSTGRIDPPWVLTEGWQGFSGQNNFLEFGKTPYVPGENGGVRGHVIYSSTRPFDDPQFGTQNVWEPLVPGVTVNLYQETTAADGSVALKLVDTTKTSSWDDWAQGFRSDGKPNMNCPGQIPAPTATAPGDLFFFSLYNQPDYLDTYNAQHNGTTAHTVPYNSQYKCYDGMHNWNQLQPAPYDGMYQFPSVTAMDPITGKPTGSNCTGCISNPDSTDPYRGGTNMLPAGKYVVEVVVPPGYELVKEEDKNILIGDNFIAPLTVQFPGLGSAIYILPDQAQVASSYNANSVQNPTNSLGRSQPLTSHEGDTPTVDTFWPCVGQTRIVPDYISLFPGSHEVAPFAGATRNLCDRKLVTLDDQTSSQAEFFIFTSTHVAAHFAGVITDDFTSEFDPFSPQFGEKFSPPDLPISIKDWTGTEVSRVYADHWGAYNGLTYSTWEVNPPNPTGYSPTMMVTCMNDPGTGATPDPLYNPAYSQFCYEIPFMPGATQYMDTPVVPTSAFAGAGYNNPDCAYPDATPAVSEVDGDVVGPWVSAPGKTLTINALGNQTVNNNAYSGPQQTAAPYNQKTITRHYGFGSQCTTPSSTSTTCNTMSSVTIGGAGAAITGWTDTQITVTVPSGVPTCAVQQQAQYGGSNAACGELTITAGNGKQSIDAVTVTIGGKTPTLVPAGGSIQAALDAAAPGDMIIVPPGSYTEMLLMWKPVRLQGVGAASSVINANTHPAGKIIPWRRQVNCLFGLALDGTPLIDGTGASHPYDPTGKYSCPAHSSSTSAVGPNGNVWNYFVNPSPNPIVDRLPLEAVVGWDATLNGNLAEQLQEPTLMGAYEGAGITVLAKGVRFTPGSSPFGSDTYPTDATLLSTGNCATSSTNATNPYPGNFQCNPSSIDGLSVTNSSQGGGGIFVHAWAHNLQIANNRVHSNTGTLTGGITVGQGEFPPANIQGGTANAAPGSCQTSRTLNTQLPYCFDLNVNVHNNAVTSNSSIGDELFSSTPAGAGGVTFCTGSDFYKFNYNWLCGNLSSGDGGGFAHMGFSYNGDIEHNSVLFNQSTNPTVPTNGGGLLVMGAPDTDPVCGAAPDGDCAPGTSDGIGPGLTINANLIMGNSAESGSGGGIRFQGVNGTDVATFPMTPGNWYTVNVTNNIIANNVAGWDGAGVSLIDALKLNFVNNTVMSNDTTASSGVLFNTIGAPIASSSGPTCTTNCGTRSAPQPAGLVAVQNSAGLMAVLPATIRCPAGYFAGNNPVNATCRNFSYPLLANDVFWQNRTFYIGVGGLASGTVNQQNTVQLYNAFTTALAASQPQADSTTPNGGGLIITGGTGACTTTASTAPAAYWDIGVRGDTGPANHSGSPPVAGVPQSLAPSYSVITDAGDYPNLHNTPANPTVLSQYCNGSRIPPELGSSGYQVPPGISDATVPNPVFNLTPAATVDEGNNWINIAFGPLALLNPLNGTTLGNYAPAAGSPVINYIPSSANANYSEAPTFDFFGTARKTNNAVDAGAVEFLGVVAAIANVSGGPLAFGNIAVGQTSAARTLTLHNTGTAALTGITLVFNPTLYSRAGGTCTPTLAAGSTCTITVAFSPTAIGTANGTLTITASVAVAGSPVTLTGAGIAGVTGASLTPTTWTVSQTRNCPGTGFLGQLFCTFDPFRMFMLQNTGNVALTGISNALTATPANQANLANYSNAGTTCGATLAPGASCIIGIQFKPLTSQPAGLKAVTLTVTDSAGTQSAAINGTAL